MSERSGTENNSFELCNCCSLRSCETEGQYELMGQLSVRNLLSLRFSGDIVFFSIRGHLYKSISYLVPFQ